LRFAKKYFHLKDSNLKKDATTKAKHASLIKQQELVIK
jgi:hypothetical protein